MNTKHIAVVASGFGLLFLAGCYDEKEHVPAEMHTEMSEEKMMGEKTMPEMSAGKMIEYSSEKFEMALQNEETVVLAFSATWCPSCKAVEADIMKNVTKIPENITLIKVDFDTETALKQQYNVVGQHTFVQVDSKGNEVKTWRGSPTLKALVSEIQ